MERAYEWLYRRTGRWYLLVIAAIEVVSALLIALGTIGVFRLYVHMSSAEFLRILAVTEVLVLAALAYGFVLSRAAWEPLRRWVAKDHDGLDPAEVWRSAVSVPLGHVTRGEKATVVP